MDNTRRGSELEYLRLVEVQAGAVGVVALLVQFHLHTMRGVRIPRGVRRRTGRRVLRQVVSATRCCARPLLSATVQSPVSKMQADSIGVTG